MTPTTYAELRLLYGARFGFSPEAMARALGTTPEAVEERLRAICGGDPVEPALTTAIRARPAMTGKARPSRRRPSSASSVTIMTMDEVQRGLEAYATGRT